MATLQHTPQQNKQVLGLPSKAPCRACPVNEAVAVLANPVGPPFVSPQAALVRDPGDSINLISNLRVVDMRSALDQVDLESPRTAWQSLQGILKSGSRLTHGGGRGGRRRIRRLPQRRPTHAQTAAACHHPAGTPAHARPMLLMNE